MKLQNKVFLLFSVLAVLLVFYVASATAQTGTSSWSQCTDGRSIVRCETYDCPQGDTNKDGACTLTDSNARLTDARNDSFCANPISGCGQVQYYPGGANTSCLVRVEEKGSNCDLYSVANPNFTPRPTTSPSPTATPLSTTSACVSLTANPQRGLAPLTVNFEAKATDPKGAIKGYDFEITKPTATEPGVITQNSNKLKQVFTAPGEYKIKVTVTDSQNKEITSNSCSTTVTVTTGDAGGDSELPRTGPTDNLAIFGIIAAGIVGVFLYERYKLA